MDPYHARKPATAPCPFQERHTTAKPVAGRNCGIIKLFPQKDRIVLITNMFAYLSM